MSEGTNVGSIFLDLVVRDTVEKQIQDIAAKAQAQARQAFTGVEKTMTDAADRAAAHAARSAQSAADQVDKALHKVSDTASATGKRVETTFDGAFDKTVALAQAKVNELVRSLDAVTDKLNEQWNAGIFDPGSKATGTLLAQQEKLLAQLEAAEERLAISKQAAAQKATQAAEQAAARQAAAVQKQKAAEEAQIQKAATAAERAANMRAAAEQKAAAATEQAAQKAADAEERAANRRKNIQASMWKNMLAKADSTVKAITAKIFDINKGFTAASKTANRFGSRLREIVSGALIFNGIGAAIRKVTQYFGEAVSASSEMKEALANLQGAAATAAAPLIEAVTPALVALTNAAAAAFSYLSRLISVFTGKSLASMAEAAKKVQTSANAAKKAMASLAGFDEIQRLGGDSGSDSGDETAEPNYDFQGQSSFLDTIMEAVKAGQWGQVGVLIAQKLNESLAAIQWPDIQEKAKTWTQNLVDAVNGFSAKLDWGTLGTSIGEALNTLNTIIDGFFQGIDWIGLGSGLGTGLNGLLGAVDWEMLGRVLTDKFKAMFEAFHGFVDTFDFSALGTSLAALFNGAFANIDWPQLAADVSAGIVGLLDAATAFVSTLDWMSFGTTIYECMMAIDWGGMFAGLLELLTALAVGLLLSLGSGVAVAFQDLGTTISGYFTDVGENGIQGFLDGMLALLADIGTWLYDHLVKPVIDGVCSALGIHSPSKVFEEIGVNLIAGLLGGIEATWNSISDFLVGAFEAVQKSLTEIWEVGIVGTLKNAINSIIGFVNGLISGVVSGINSVIRALNNLSFDVPDWVPGIGGQKFGFNLSTLWAPQIPYLADGGVITQPTLAMMGEYAGARNNPEIVTPQDILKETFLSVMDDYAASNLAGQEAIVEVLREILEAVLGIELGDEVLGQAVARYNRKLAVMRGGT